MTIVRIPFYKIKWDMFVENELFKKGIDKSKPYKVWRDLYTFEYVFEQN